MWAGWRAVRGAGLLHCRAGERRIAAESGGATCL